MARDTKQVLHKFEKQLTPAIFKDPALGLKGAQTTRIVEIAESTAATPIASSNGHIPPAEWPQHEKEDQDAL